jgi:hypothetical protein
MRHEMLVHQTANTDSAPEAMSRHSANACVLWRAKGHELYFATGRFFTGIRPQSWRVVVILPLHLLASPNQQL